MYNYALLTSQSTLSGHVEHCVPINVLTQYFGRYISPGLGHKKKGQEFGKKKIVVTV